MLKFSASIGSRDFMSPGVAVYLWSALNISSHASTFEIGRIYTSSRCFTHSAEHGNTGDFKISAETKFKVPVLIVGAGPVGLSLSILLSKYGIRSLVAERKSELSQHPQAHFLNNRTMEIFRKMEGLESEIRGLQPPLDQWRKFVYCNTLSGPILGTVDHFNSQDNLDKRSPTSVGHFSQHRLLPLLLKRAQKLHLSVHPKNKIDMDGILLGHKLVSLQANNIGVVARLSSSSGSLNTLKDVECRYLVAADGAGSFVRHLMGVGMEGEVDMQKLISVHFLSKELGHYLLINQPGMLYFVFNAQVIAVIIAHDLTVGEFIAQIPYYPPQQVLKDFTKEVCKKIICDVAGIQNLEMEIKEVKEWVMDALVADNFVTGHGRIFLAGDAAHRFPPAGGFGLNTGIQDAHNLAWKLAATLNGYAPPDLLLTYESERRPIAKANTALSVANWKAAMAIPIALGLSPSAARAVLKVVSSKDSWLPEGLQRAILGVVFTIARFQVSPLFLSKFNPVGFSRIAQVKKILQQGDSLQLQFPAEDLGFRYQCGAIFPEKPDPSELDADSLEGVKDSMGRRHEYVPSTRPGTRMPHCFISNLGQDGQISDKAIFSTLDLISSDRLSFLLVIGPGKSGCRWGDAALESVKSCQMPIRVAMLWPKGIADRVWASFHSAQDRSSGLTEEESYVIYEWGYQNRDFVTHVEEVNSSWWERTLSSSAAILVRPDGHIAWRTISEADNGASLEIERVLKCVLKQKL